MACLGPYNYGQRDEYQRTVFLFTASICPTGLMLPSVCASPPAVRQAPRGQRSICFQKLKFSKGNSNSQKVIRSIVNMSSHAETVEV